MGRSNPGVFTVSGEVVRCDARPVASYLAEAYLSKSSDFGLSARQARRAAEALGREGIRVRYVRSTFMPEDEICLHVFEADSAEDVRSVGTRARIEFDRIVDAVECSRTELARPEASRRKR